MQTATLSEIKRATLSLTQKELIDICLRLAKYRKENKELLSYLLFDADDQVLFVKQVKDEMDLQFAQINTTQVYLAKKTIRKVLRTAQKFIRFSGSKQTEVEILLHYCHALKTCGIPIVHYPVIANIFHNQLNKAKKSLQSLHEDLQYDYGQQLKQLQQPGT